MNVLILGKGSYLGEHLKKWLEQYPQKYSVDIVPTKNRAWEKEDFSKYNTVVNFAGIAHISNITADMEELFYSVNRDLAIDMCKFSKKSGVKHFIHFSSMNVYGDFCDNVSNREAVNPTSFYGRSKLEGDIGIQALSDDEYIVSSIRPPFVYGKGCKGNYNSISNIAKKTPIFPNYKNKKSMIYIDNLCEFIRLLIDYPAQGVFTPQNKELVSTADLVREISKVNGHKVVFIKLFNLGIPVVCKLTRLVRRGFANDNYILELSDYFGWKYNVVDFKTSVIETEK